MRAAEPDHSAAGDLASMLGVPPQPASADASPIGLRLQCPRCRGGIDALDCKACGFAVAIEDGILRALTPESRAHFAGFVRDYERVRACEARGSDSDAFYLGLPYRDASGRNTAQWRIRARSYRYVSRRLLAELDPRRRRVLDLGAGNGWMSYRLALAGFQPCAVDLLANDSDGLGAARHFSARLPAVFPRVQADLARLPFADQQFDAAVFNASFHYAEQPEAALGEALRCVRAGGLVVISDTPWYASDRSGRQMVAERRAAFGHRYGTACDGIESLDYLTDERLQRMAGALAIHWEIHRPWYGLRWALRPLAARLRGRREPSRFRLHVVRKA
jgi:SAM-dependent methyltransferase